MEEVICISSQFKTTKMRLLQFKYVKGKGDGEKTKFTNKEDYTNIFEKKVKRNGDQY